MKQFLVRHTPWHPHWDQPSATTAALVWVAALVLFVTYYLGLWAATAALEAYLADVSIWVALPILVALIAIPAFAFGAFCPSHLGLLIPVIGHIIGSAVWWSSPWGSFVDLTYDGWGSVLMYFVVAPVALVWLPSVIGQMLGYDASLKQRGQLGGSVS